MSRLASYTKGYIDVRTINTQITILHFNSIPSQIKTKKKRETFLFCGLINAKTNKKETEKIKSNTIQRIVKPVSSIKSKKKFTKVFEDRKM